MSITDKTMEKVISVLRNYRGEKHSIPAELIAKRAGIFESHATCVTTRKIIKEIKSRGILPIGSNSNGFFVIITEDEMRKYTYGLVRRMKGIQANIDATHRAFYGGKY